MKIKMLEIAIILYDLDFDLDLICKIANVESIELMEYVIKENTWKI